MAAAENADLTEWLLSFLCFVIVMGGLMVFLVFQWRHRQNLPPGVDPDDELDHFPPLPTRDLPQFALKRANSWLAIKSGSVHAVQSALALHDTKPCSWAEGLSGDGEQCLFVSPPVAGWILVIGPALPDPADDVDACYRFLADLSRKLGHVQYFHSNCILNHHAWVRAESGRMVRAYAWAGKTLWNQGPPTPAEHLLNVKCYDYCEIPEPANCVPAEPVVTNSEKVHLLAARWSLDPGDIGWRGIGRERGVIGQTSGRF
jgi:hypothetical protein